jgi:hypothetical protein
MPIINESSAHSRYPSESIREPHAKMSGKMRAIGPTLPISCRATSRQLIGVHWSCRHLVAIGRP